MQSSSPGVMAVAEAANCPGGKEKRKRRRRIGRCLRNHTSSSSSSASCNPVHRRTNSTLFLLPPPGGGEMQRRHWVGGPHSPFFRHRYQLPPNKLHLLPLPHLSPQFASISHSRSDAAGGFLGASTVRGKGISSGNFLGIGN